MASNHAHVIAEAILPSVEAIGKPRGKIYGQMLIETADGLRGLYWVVDENRDLRIRSANGIEPASLSADEMVANLDEPSREKLVADVKDNVCNLLGKR